MKNKIILCCLLATMFIVTGCLNDQEDESKETSEDTNELGIETLSIVTEAYSYNTSWKIFCNELNSSCLPPIENQSNFYLPHEFSKARYRINGTMKNIAGYPLNYTLVNLNFYDENNTYLFNEQLNNFSKLEAGETRFFEFEYDYFDIYFKEIDYLTITTGLKPIEIKGSKQQDGYI